MKQSRRKELKTNELGEYLLQCHEWASRNANYLLGGVVVIVLVLGISWVVHSNRLQARQSAWTEYNELHEVPSVTPTHIERADNLAAKFGQTSDLGPRVTFLKADLAYKRAMNLTGEADREQRVKLLQEAKDTLLSIPKLFADNRQAIAQAHMRLAAVEESLFMAGKGDKEQIRSYYQQVINEKTAPYVEDASDQLETLDERLALLPLVASRPAEEAATQPAIDNAPAANTAPAAG